MPLRHFVQFVVIWKAEINPEGDVPFLSFFLFFSCIHFIGGGKSNANEVPRFSCAWVMINRNIGKTEKVLGDLVCATFPKLSQLYLFWRKLASTFFRILLMEHLHLCSPVLSNPNTRKIFSVGVRFPSCIYHYVYMKACWHFSLDEVAPIVSSSHCRSCHSYPWPWSVSKTESKSLVG